MSRSDHGIRLRIFIGSTCQRDGRGLHLIVVNGFYASNSELYPNDNLIDPDDWKREGMGIFDGCREAVGDHVGFGVDQSQSKQIDRLVNFK
jgi:hypothetical protein